MESIHLEAYQRQEFNHYHRVDNLLHNQFIPSLPAIYLAALRDPVIDFGNTMTLQLLAHLHDQYRWITESDLDSNTEWM
jgi:hypothetical protein